MTVRATLKPLIFVLSLPYRLIPAPVRRTLVVGLLGLESRIGPPAVALGRLFAVKDTLNLLIAERATAYGEGEHPKHRLTRYHAFFCARVPAGSRVLDIGCGYGAVARSIARQVAGVEVVGVELDDARLAQAGAADNPENLRFVKADARHSLPDGPWQTVVLSNIVEHIEDRVGFLRDIVEQAKPDTILIRVPLFERDWEIAMRRELGANYFSDETHFIEHTREEFLDEMKEAGLETTECLTLWGEIWASCRPITSIREQPR